MGDGSIVNGARFSSWLYRLGGPETHGGVGLTPAGAVELASDDRSLRQSILLLLATVPGERVMRPEYGCPLDGLVFLPNDDTTAGMAIHAVRTSLERWEPRIEIIALDARRDPDDDGRLVIELSYRAKSSGSTTIVSITTPVGG